MFRSFPIGRVQGIDVFLHPTLLLIPLMGLTGGGAEGLALAVAVFGCVFLHELGHARMAAVYGIRTSSITLYPIGGVAALERIPRSAGPELLVALAGPAVNFVLAGILGLIQGFDWFLLGVWPNHFLAVLTVVNLQLGLFNLLPVFPMDGGRVLRALLSGPLGRVRATEVAAGLGQLLAIVGGTLFLLNGALMPAALCLFVYVVAGAERASVVAEDARRRGPTWIGSAPSWGGRGPVWSSRGTWVRPIRVRVVEPKAP